ncbi:uncharacterized protein [Acropora muricata]|uniref:E3 ubiquitin-protein ligase complex slx8-rfp subunit slx8-like n=1 Tax=Acropora millepora TaxID=45264 RepID=UPI001CF35388|nr:E3 ubiquitin-protein ligase complex slx8-rfp subunit slx8-like [Acropora millepora]
MEQPVTSRMLRYGRRAAVNGIPPRDQPSTSSLQNGDWTFHLPISLPDELSSTQEESECLTRKNKRNRPNVENKLRENHTESTGETLPLINESPDENLSSDKKRRRIADDSEDSPSNITTNINEQIAVGSQGLSPTRSQEDVIILGDVQVARPEVIDLEHLPTIRQGGSVVVDLTNDANLHDSNVVDLTRDNSSDSSFDTNPVIVCVNQIYHRDPAHRLPSCRFESFPSLLDTAFNAVTRSTCNDEVQEVSNIDANSTQDSSLNSSSSSPKEQKNYDITCPICMDDDKAIKRRKSQLMSTTCGHVFCDKCIRSAVQLQRRCPTCRKKLSLKQLHAIFL